MSPVLERLTYLLTICTGVIGWSVTETAQRVSSAKVLAYSLTTEIIVESPQATTILWLENLSRAYEIRDVQVSFNTDKDNTICKLRQRGPQFVDIVPEMKVIPDPSTQEPSLYSVGIQSFPPGSSVFLRATHSADCKASAEVKLAATDSLSPASGAVRILKSGLESGILRNQFALLTGMIGTFGIVFCCVFYHAYRSSDASKVSSPEPSVVAKEGQEQARNPATNTDSVQNIKQAVAQPDAKPEGDRG